MERLLHDMQAAIESEAAAPLTGRWAWKSTDPHAREREASGARVEDWSRPGEDDGRTLRATVE